jgi:hypothetical protein
MSVQNRFRIDPTIRSWGWFSVVVVVFIVAIGKGLAEGDILHKAKWELGGTAAGFALK